MNDDIALQIKYRSDNRVFVLVLDTKTVIFNPTKDTYHLLPGDAHDKFKEIVATHAESPNKTLQHLKEAFDICDRIEGYVITRARERSDTGAELISFNDRFQAFLAKEAAKYNVKASLRLMLLISWAMLIAKFLLRVGKFDILIHNNSGSKKAAPSHFSANVGHNISLVRRLVPIVLDCKIVAYVYKRIYAIYGYQCDIAIGILNEPFVAHMWAMSDETPHGEMPDVVENFQFIYRSSW